MSQETGAYPAKSLNRGVGRGPPQRVEGPLQAPSFRPRRGCAKERGRVGWSDPDGIPARSEPLGHLSGGQ